MPNRMVAAIHRNLLDADDINCLAAEHSHCDPPQSIYLSPSHFYLAPLSSADNTSILTLVIRRQMLSYTERPRFVICIRILWYPLTIRTVITRMFLIPR